MHPPQTTNAGGGYGTSGNGVDTGYVLLKRKDDGQMVTVKSPNASGNSNQAQQPQTQPQSLPTIPQTQMQYQHPHQLNRENEVDRKYFSVKNFHRKMFLRVQILFRVVVSYVLAHIRFNSYSKLRN